MCKRDRCHARRQHGCDGPGQEGCGQEGSTSQEGSTGQGGSEEGRRGPQGRRQEGSAGPQGRRQEGSAGPQGRRQEGSGQEGARPSGRQEGLICRTAHELVGSSRGVPVASPATGTPLPSALRSTRRGQRYAGSTVRRAGAA